MRYTPNVMWNYFYERKVSGVREDEKLKFVVGGDSFSVELIFNPNKNYVEHAKVIEFDEVLGKVVSTFKYEGYKVVADAVSLPMNIRISKFNAHIEEYVRVKDVSFPSGIAKILSVDVEAAKENSSEKIHEIKHKKYSENVHFFEISESDSRTIAVEFSSFVLAIEAPLSTRIGRSLVKEINQATNGKPIRYFTFGYHHPHYLGGVRAFNELGATLLTRVESREFIEEILGTEYFDNKSGKVVKPHSPTIEVLSKDTVVISEDGYSIEIRYLGAESNHTVDYMYYYFPKEKMIFEGDLVWVYENGKRGESSSQISLKSDIAENKLNVNEVIQAWPLTQYGVKTIIPIAEL